MLYVESDLPTTLNKWHRLEGSSVDCLEAWRWARTSVYNGDNKPSGCTSTTSGCPLHLQTARAPQLGPLHPSRPPTQERLPAGPQWGGGSAAARGGGGEPGWGGGRGGRRCCPGGGGRREGAAAAAASGAAAQTLGAAEAVSRSAFRPLLRSESVVGVAAWRVCGGGGTGSGC